MSGEPALENDDEDLQLHQQHQLMRTCSDDEDYAVLDFPGYNSSSDGSMEGWGPSQDKDHTYAAPR